jgi:hypothetical protein
VKPGQKGLSWRVPLFEIHPKRLRPARQEAAQTESGALKKAENLVKRMPRRWP